MKVTRSAPLAGGGWRGLNRTHQITLRGVRALLQRIWTQALPEPGFAYDFADLTDAKINWRRNWASETEFRNGIGDAPVRGGTGIAYTALAPYAGGIAFTKDANGSYAYKQMAFVAGNRYWMSVIVKMDDGAAPVFTSGDVAAAGNDFVLVLKGDALSTTSYTVTPLNNGFYSVAMFADLTVSATGNYGVVKYGGNSTRNFKVTGYQVSRSPLALPYQYITDAGAGDYLREFPTAALYQDHVGNLPVTSVEQPVGLVLDMRQQGFRGVELSPDVGMNTPAAWTFTGTAPLWSVANGIASVTATSTANRWIVGGTNLLTVGKWYEVYADVVVTAGGCLPDISSNYSVFATTSGRKHWILQATSTALQFLANGAFTGSIDNVSFREVPGNHALQPTTGDRPTMTGRLNVLMNTEALNDTTYWTKSANGTGTAPVVTDAYAAAPDGTLTATRIQMALGGGTTTADQSRLLQAINTVIQGNYYLHHFWARTNDGTTKQVSLRDDFSGTVNTILTITPAWQQFVGPVNQAANNTTVNAIGLWLRGGIGTSDSVDMLVWHPQVERSATLQTKPMAYQRVGTVATDYDPIGFPKGAKFNGSNSWMFTPVIDFSGSDKLHAGVSFKKEADPTTAVDAVLLEQGTIYTGSGGRLVLASSVGGTTSAGFYVQGSTGGTGSQSVVTPGASVVLTGAVDWNTSTATRLMRLNTQFVGTTPATGAGGVGGVTQTGAAQIVYIGRRGGTGTSFNGVIYRASLRGTDYGNALAANERWLNEPIKAYT